MDPPIPHQLMIRLALLFSVFFSIVQVQAQYYMPDAALRAWVSANFPGAITGNMIDETHYGVASATVLDISSNGIVNLEGMGAFGNLQGLDASSNPINKNSLGALPASLRSLSLANCGLTGQLSFCFAQYTQLRALIISDNQLTSVAWCGERPSEELNASNNLLTGWVGDPPYNMISYNLAHNQLAVLPDGLGAQYIDISHNLLTELPWTSGGSCQTLNASHNLLTSVSDFSCAVNMDLSHNLIESVDIGCMGTLYLNLSHNPLTGGADHVPNTLETLEITDTQLDCLPMLPLPLETLLSTGNAFTCLPNIPSGLDLSPDNLGFAPIICTLPSPCANQPPQLMLRACLQGAWDTDTQLMRDDLRAQGLIPLSEPYSAMGYTYLNNSRPLSIPATMLQTTGPEAIVDWVIVEFRAGPYVPGQLLQSLPALLRRDGRVIATTGDLELLLEIPQGSYRVAMKHRNHLGAITFGPHVFQNGPTAVDIMSSYAQGGAQVNPYAHATGPDGIRMLIMGDVNGDKKVSYSGQNNDRDPILIAIGGTWSTATITDVYLGEDVNMDGMVKYTGAGNDRDLILQVLGGFDPTTTKTQVPVY